MPMGYNFSRMMDRPLEIRSMGKCYLFNSLCAFYQYSYSII